MAGEARTERRGPRAARLPATITAWLRREADAARRSAHRALQAPGPERDAAAQALKAALAAFLAWAVTAWWWEAPMALMAPWAAVVLVQSTVYRSLHSAGLQLAVVATGTLLAAGAAALTGSIVAALLIALPRPPSSAGTPASASRPRTPRPPSSSSSPTARTAPPRSGTGCWRPWSAR